MNWFRILVMCGLGFTGGHLFMSILFNVREGDIALGMIRFIGLIACVLAWAYIFDH